MAADTVHATAALLHCGLKTTGPLNNACSIFSAQEKIRKDGHGSEIGKIRNHDSNSYENSICNFWWVWQALDSKNDGVLQAGIQLAKRLQQFFISQTRVALTQKSVKRMGKLRVYDMVAGPIN